MSTPLVVVFLRGGLDGLSLLRPPGDALDRARGAAALPADLALPVGDGWSLHPTATRLASRAAAGSVAFLPASGVPGTSRSHFEAQATVERCGPTTESTGFLGRALSAGAAGSSPFRGVSIGQPQTPALLRGSADVLATAGLTGIRLRPGAGVTETSMAALWRDDRGPLTSSATGALVALDRARTIQVPANADEAEQMVALFGAGVGAEVGVLNVGGWDHHDQIGVVDGTFDRMIGQLDDTVETLVAGIPGVTVLVVSEFGRRVAANDSGGFDHGRGGLAFVVGDRVRGGVAGDWPGLTDLDEGDVRSANDLRCLVAEVAERVLQVDPARVAPGAPATRFDLLT
jgi:uncharacterized protein (DUF1501 family)